MPPIPEDRPTPDLAGCDVVGPSEPPQACPPARRSLAWPAADYDASQPAEAGARERLDFREEIARQA